MLQLRKASIPEGRLEELVPIYETDFGKMVDAKELHKTLGVKKKFADWIKGYILPYNGFSYGSESVEPTNPTQYDYFMYEIAATQNRGKSKEYIVTLDMAKEISMMSKSESGHIVRQYFISVEKAFSKLVSTLQDSLITQQEKLAQAVIISNNLIAENQEAIKRANRNKDYNKKVNVKLRREIKELKAKTEVIQTSGHIDMSPLIAEKEIIIKEKDDRILYLEEINEQLEDNNAKLHAKNKFLIKMKADGRGLLNSFAAVDVGRRQKFVVGAKKKDDAKVQAYVFRKDCILAAGIVTAAEPGKSFVETINVNDLERALIVYVSSLKKLVDNDELFYELFDYQIKKTNEFLGKIQFERENEDSVLEEQVTK